jgi:predicted porin
MLRSNILFASALVWVASSLPHLAMAAGQYQGHVEAGVRDTDVDGDETKYRQYVDLDDGPRLMSFAIEIVPEKANGAPDHLSIEASGLGGDPYEHVRLIVKEHGVYAFSYDRHTSDYFYEDLLLRPEDASVEQATGGDFHHYDFERIRDRADMNVVLSDAAKLSLDYDRYEKTGESTTTLDVEREEFELDKPIDEVLQAYRIGLEYSWEWATLLVSAGRSDYENESSVFLPGFSPGTELAEPTELDYYFLDQPYSYDADEYTVTVRAEPTDKTRVSISIADIDLDLNLEALERSQGVDYLDVPFTRDFRGEGVIGRDTTLVDASVEYMVNDRVSVELEARRYGLEQRGVLEYADEPSASAWDLDTASVGIGAQWRVNEAIVVAGSWMTERRDSEFFAVSDITEARDVETERDGFDVQVSYRPNKRLSLTLSVEDNRIDDPYTLASATDSRRYRLRGRYRFDNGLHLTASYKLSELENDATDWESSHEQIDLRVGYTIGDVSLSMGVSDIELEREIDQLVVGDILPFRQDLFSIAYAADARFWDGAAQIAIDDRTQVYASFRRYSNDGSFDVDRNDLSFGIDYTISPRYLARLNLRNIDYDEAELESFDADIWELALRYAW